MYIYIILGDVIVKKKEEEERYIYYPIAYVSSSCGKALASQDHQHGTRTKPQPLPIAGAVRCSICPPSQASPSLPSPDASEPRSSQDLIVP